MITVSEADRGLVSLAIATRAKICPKRQRLALHTWVLLLERAFGINLGYRFTLRHGLVWSAELEVDLDDLAEAPPWQIDLPLIVRDRIDDAVKALSEMDDLIILGAVALLVPEYDDTTIEQLLSERFSGSLRKIRLASAWSRIHLSGGHHEPAQRLGVVVPNPSDTANILRALNQVVALAGQLGIDIVAQVDLRQVFDTDVAPPAFTTNAALPENVYPLRAAV